jgi:hypothetical protein
VKYKFSDQTKILVDLYGSEEGFLEEYENHLSETVLLNKKFDKRKELTDIELLKQRFGEFNLLRCNVLLKDIQNSERYNKNCRQYIQSKKRDSSPYMGLSQMSLSTLIVSTGYWPINSNDTFFNFPEPYAEIFDQYQRNYQSLNHIKKLQFHNNLGSVKVSLTFDAGEEVFKCQPVQAVLIGYFDEDNMEGNKISLEFLATKLQADPRYVRKKMFYWIHKGVVVENKANQKSGNLRSFEDNFDEGAEMANITYSLVEDYEPHSGEDLEESQEEEVFEILQEEEHESISQEFLSFRADNFEDVQSLEKEIMNILLNNGPKKIDKLHYLIDTIGNKTQFLMGWNKSNIEELLESMIKRGKIRYENYVYYPNNA